MDSGPLSTIRNILLWSLLAGSAGTLLELLLIGHDEMATQFAPLVLLGIGILAAAWTLIVLIAVLIIKYVLFRRTAAIGVDAGSTAVKADAWHHASDAFTSAAAFIGITIALWGGPGWESADDWAALFASAIIAYNGTLLVRPALHDLMDRMPEPELVDVVRRAAESVDGVRAVEKLTVRRAGMVFYVNIHVQADAAMSLHDAHELSGAVKAAIRRAERRVSGVLVHMEPFADSARTPTGV